MAGELKGCVIAIFAANGVDGGHVARVREGLTSRGARLHVLCPEGDLPRALGGGDLDLHAFIEQASPGYYDGLVIPGGPEAIALLAERRAVIAFVVEMHARGRPVGAIEEGARLLELAGLFEGRHLSVSGALIDAVSDGGGFLESKPVTSHDGVVTCADADAIDAFCEHYARAVRAFRVRDAVDEAGMESFPASDAGHGSAAI